MSTTRILTLGAVALLLYFAVLYGSRALFPRTVVGYDTPVAGRVTGYFAINSQRSFFLNGNTKTRYDFDAFTSARPAAGPTRPPGIDLSGYLRKGDYLRKAARAAALTVQRGDSLSRWTCAPPEAPH